MGIIEQLEAEARANPTSIPSAWTNAEDKLEEWLGIVPEGTMKPKTKKASAVSDQITIDLKLAAQASDIYRPTDFRSSVDYARALVLYKKKIPEGYAAGYIIKVVLGNLEHVRRIAEPVRSKAEAYLSPEFTLAITEAIRSILEYEKK